MQLPAPSFGRPGPAGNPAPPDPSGFVLNWGPHYSLRVVNLGLACCAVEFLAAAARRPELAASGVAGPSGGQRRVELLVVSGTVSDKLAPAVRRMYDTMPAPRYVLSFGACANSGGPYWDSYSVTKGVDQLIPVDVYVPGCPPRPEALLHGVQLLLDRIAGAGSAAVNT